MSAKPSLVDAARRARSSRVLVASGAVLGIALAIGGVLIAGRAGSTTMSSDGLPNTADYHSLLVAPANPDELVLGTHDGLFRSTDAGLTWVPAELSGRDAMNLARPGDGRTVWAAGHDVLARSTDGGTTWADVRPDGLPGLDVHGFAVDPSDPRTIYAAIAGRGLYRSTDGGATFEEASTEVGPAVMALAVLPGGSVIAGDLQTEALVASHDRGATWSPVARTPVIGLAVASDGSTILASGPGVFLSTDRGATWRQTLRHDAGTGPVAWSPSDPQVGYAVALDRVLFRTDDGGKTWAPVATGT